MKTEEGFTLLESLFALSLIAILLITLFQIAGDGLAKSRKAEQAALAASVGKSLFSKVGLSTYFSSEFRYVENPLFLFSRNMTLLL